MFSLLSNPCRYTLVLCTCMPFQIVPVSFCSTVCMLYKS
nr:MAG TPA: hypothetical protein [Bacteriophage sp.]